MQRIGQVIPGSRHGFYFLQQHLLGRGQQTVNASPDLQGEFVSFHCLLNGNFRLVTRRA